MSIFDRPTSKELLEVVVDFINTEIKSSAYPSNKKFKLQIVANILNIVKREVEFGEEINRKLSEMGKEITLEENFSTEKLSYKIRNEEISSDNESLIDFLFELAMEKVKIDNPKYTK